MERAVSRSRSAAGPPASTSSSAKPAARTALGLVRSPTGDVNAVPRGTSRGHLRAFPVEHALGVAPGPGALRLTSRLLELGRAFRHHHDLSIPSRAHTH